MKFIKDESQHGSNMEPEFAENEKNIKESKKQVSNLFCVCNN